MAVSGWKDRAKTELVLELAGKHYYFEIKDNADGSKRVEIREWQKTHGFRQHSETRTLFVFENHLRDILKALLKVCDRLDVPVKDILERKGVVCELTTRLNVPHDVNEFPVVSGLN
jgi:hypothetical protein